jgi:hypothetical protein
MKKAASTPLGWVGSSPPLLSLTATPGFSGRSYADARFRRCELRARRLKSVLVEVSLEFASVSRTNEPPRIRAHWFAKRRLNKLCF